MIGCVKSDYARLVKTEISKNVINDTLILGLKLGNSKQDFFDTCWKLNNQGVIMQGPKNEFVQYDLPFAKKDSVNPKITLLFYGIFNGDKIMTGLKMKFYYEAWSLWNRSLQSDKLLPVVKDSLLNWFPGNRFIPVNLKKDDKQVLVKVDGNRRIIIKPIKDNREIDVQIDDLRFKKEFE